MTTNRRPRINWKLTEETARQVHELAQAEITLQKDIASTFGISESHVSNIKVLRRWKCLGLATKEDGT